MSHHVSQGHPAGQRCSWDLHAESPMMRALATPLTPTTGTCWGSAQSGPNPVCTVLTHCPHSLFSTKLKRTVQDLPAPGLCLGCSLRLGGSLNPVSLTC